VDQLDNFIPLNFLIIFLTERQSAWMSKISYDGLTRSDTGSIIAVCTWQQWPSKG